MRTYCVYIMASGSGVLYIGVTNNLEQRVAQHQQKLVPGFTARYNVRKLVYYELFTDIRLAIAREKRLKALLRKRKIALIESANPGWKDLSAELARFRAADSAKVGKLTKALQGRRPASAIDRNKRDSSSLRSSE